MLSVAPAALAADPPGSVVLQSTGAVQTVTVPAGVTSVGVQLAGGGGGSGVGGFQDGGAGGKGAVLSGYLTVTPGTVLDVYVGGQGGHYGTNPDNAHGGWGGPASGGSVENPAQSQDATGGGGGGATTLLVGGDVIGTAGGGGGGAGSNNFAGGAGGDAGDPAHDGFHGGGPSGTDGYGLGGHAGKAPSSEGLPGGCGSCGNDGFGDGYGGGGGGGTIGGEGGHGGTASGGGGGAGTSSASAALANASVTTMATLDSGYASFDWVLDEAPTVAGDVVLQATGASQSVTVPDGATAMSVTVAGGAGGDSSHTTGGGGDDASGGKGASVTGTIAVAPGAVITVDVGGEGGHYGTSTNGNAGGWGASMPGGESQVTTDDLGKKYGGGGGGGASSVSVAGRVLIVAGGGGGAGSAWGAYTGGAGGDAGVTAGDGYRGKCAEDEYGVGGHGADAPTGAGTKGGMKSGINQPSAGGGGGGSTGGEGGHGGSACSGGGGAGETLVQSFSVSNVTVGTSVEQTAGVVGITWHTGATLVVTPSATSIEAGGMVTFTGRLVGADGTELGEAASLALSSAEESDVFGQASAVLTRPGSRPIIVRVPGSALQATVIIEVRGATPTTLANTGIDVAGLPAAGVAVILIGLGFVGVRLMIAAKSRRRHS